MAPTRRRMLAPLPSSKITKAEERAEGQVSRRVYLSYFRWALLYLFSLFLPPNLVPVANQSVWRVGTQRRCSVGCGAMPAGERAEGQVSQRVYLSHHQVRLNPSAPAAAAACLHGLCCLQAAQAHAAAVPCFHAAADPGSPLVLLPHNINATWTPPHEP